MWGNCKGYGAKSRETMSTTFDDKDDDEDIQQSIQREDSININSGCGGGEQQQQQCQ